MRNQQKNALTGEEIRWLEGRGGAGGGKRSRRHDHSSLKERKDRKKLPKNCENRKAYGEGRHERASIVGGRHPKNWIRKRLRR